MKTIAFLQNIGFQELIIVLVIVLLLFGAKKLPELSRALGQSLKEFRKGREEEEKPASSKPEEPPKSPPAGN